MMTMTEEERKARLEDAARRLKKATQDIAAERRFGGPNRSSTELEMMDEAAQLVAEARAARLSEVTQEGVPSRVGVDPLDRVP